MSLKNVAAVRLVGLCFLGIVALSFFSGKKKIAKKLHKCVFVLFICVYLFHKQSGNNPKTIKNLAK